MTETKPATAEDDLIDTLAGIAPGSRLDLLRRERPVTRLHAQTCQEAIFGPLTASTLSLAERHALAADVATWHGVTALALFHTRQLQALSPDDAAKPERLAQLAPLAEAMALRPATVAKADLDALLQAGFSPDDIVVTGQIVGFVAYQARLLAGLSLIANEVAA